MNRVLAIVSLALSGVLIAVFSGRGGSGSVQGTFLGYVEDSAALIGLVADGEWVRAYACDSTNIASWFSGREHDNTLDVRSAGLRLQATLTAAGAEGTLTLEDGSAHGFRLQPSPAATRACVGEIAPTSAPTSAAGSPSIVAAGAVR
jgi:hypothetical protein